jgi:hypothetical protein
MTERSYSDAEFNEFVTRYRQEHGKLPSAEIARKTLGGSKATLCKSLADWRAQEARPIEIPAELHTALGIAIRQAEDAVRATFGEWQQAAEAQQAEQEAALAEAGHELDVLRNELTACVAGQARAEERAERAVEDAQRWQVDRDTALARAAILESQLAIAQAERSQLAGQVDLLNRQAVDQAAAAGLLQGQIAELQRQLPAREKCATT